MLHTEGICIGRYLTEGADEGISKAIGDLQADAEEHREDEEERHLTLLEEHESTQAKGFDEALALSLGSRRAVGERQRIER